MSRKKQTNQDPGKTAIVYLFLSLVWFVSAGVNFASHYTPLAVIYLLLGILFVVLALVYYRRR